MRMKTTLTSPCPPRPLSLFLLLLKVQPTSTAASNASAKAPCSLLQDRGSGFELTDHHANPWNRARSERALALAAWRGAR